MPAVSPTSIAVLETPIFSDQNNAIIGYSLTCADCKAILLTCEGCASLLALSADPNNSCPSTIHLPSHPTPSAIEGLSPSDVINSVSKLFCSMCGCLNMLDSSIRRYANLPARWPLSEREMVSLQLSMHGEAVYIKYKMDQYRAVARVLDSKRRSNKRFLTREKIRSLRTQKKQSNAEEDPAVAAAKISTKKVSLSVPTNISTTTIIPRPVIQKIRSSAKEKLKAYSKPSPVSTVEAVDVSDSKSNAGKGRKRKRRKRSTQMKDDILGSDNEKVDKMEVDEENGNNSNNLEQPKQTTTLQSAMNNQLETGVDALDDILEDSCKRIAETEAEIPQPKTVDIGQEKLKPKRRKKKKKKSLEANTATCELDATPLVTNPASSRYKKKSIIHDGVSDGEDTASFSAASKLVTPTIPALQPKACDNSKPVVETIVESAQLNDASAETTQRKKRKIIDIESSDSESEFVDVVQTQAPKPNITLPQTKKKQSWKLRRKTIRIDCRREKQHAALNETPQTITHSLHKHTIEGLECLLWSLRDQLTKIQSMEYVAAWRHGKYFMTAWNSNADLVQETYYQVKMLESAYDSCGDSLLRNQILSLVEVALHECKAHTSIFTSVHQRLVSGAQMEMSPTLALFVQAQYSDFLETHTVSANNQMMEKCNLVRSEIVTLWGLVDSWWAQREESENEEDGSISVYVRKREQLNMVKILMRYGTQCNNTVDFDEVEQFQTHLDENKFKEIGRERVRVKLLGLIGLYRILMTSII